MRKMKTWTNTSKHAVIFLQPIYFSLLKHHYFLNEGVPYIPRKMMLSSSPSLEISCDENGKWKITNSSLFRTVVLEFTLGEEYEEHMPGGVTIKVILSESVFSLIV